MDVDACGIGWSVRRRRARFSHSCVSADSLAGRVRRRRLLRMRVNASMPICARRLVGFCLGLCCHYYGIFWFRLFVDVSMFCLPPSWRSEHPYFLDVFCSRPVFSLVPSARDLRGVPWTATFRVPQLSCLSWAIGLSQPGGDVLDAGACACVLFFSLLLVSPRPLALARSCRLCPGFSGHPTGALCNPRNPQSKGSVRFAVWSARVVRDNKY